VVVSGVREIVVSADFAAGKVQCLSHFGLITADFLSARFVAIVLLIVSLK